MSVRIIVRVCIIEHRLAVVILRIGICHRTDRICGVVGKGQFGVFFLHRDADSCGVAPIEAICLGVDRLFAIFQ